jgi:hypothetical protein
MEKYRSKDETYPEFNKVTYNEDGFTLQLVNAQLHTLAKVAIARCYTH